eukprot:TRINITY_DN54629_c0_g1_i3.p1 TRINITY_DN54629_c0_g1~~TRINITY_DN54629_c0_g1_i3.p1  ORF type:complete len:185 (+),score=47.69 TRINITY_DN54629_c0_g1_i3:3-557(+)
MGVVEGVDELDEVERRTFEEDDGPVDCSNMAYTKICNGVRTLFPPLQWIPEYSRSDLKGDLTSGITVGCMLVPQSMAYAVLADLPPQNGLYASFIGLVVYSLFGTSRQLGLGPVAVVALMVSSTLDPNDSDDDRVKQASQLAFVVGLVPVSYTHLRAHETPEHLVCRLLLEKKKKTKKYIEYIV